MPVARIENYNGEPAIIIDGKPYPPMTVTTQIKDDEYLKKLGEAGVRIFYIIADMKWNRPGDPSFTPHPDRWAWFITPDMSVDGMTETVGNIKKLLENVPDAYVILRLNVSPSVEWINEHPDELLKFSDNAEHPVMLTNASRYDKVRGMHSMCSEIWRADADAAIHEYFDELEKLDCFDRVIGFFLCAGGTSEWYYPISLQLEGDVYGDFSEPFRKEYSKFLRKKYVTEENLRRAWKDDSASFEAPKIPTPAERTYIHSAYNKILTGLRNWEYEARGAKLDYDAKSCYNVGVFLNANEYQHTADFFDALHEGTANTVVHFAKTLKTRYPNLLVGAFYGAFGCTNYFYSGTSTGTPVILDSGYVDFLAAPGVYNNREPGGIVALREMQDSFRIRNQIFINEDDTRTHKCKPWMQREAGYLFDVNDSITVMKRDFARDICEDIQGWWFDMGGDWYNDPALLELIKRQQEISQFAYSLDRTKKNDIALIYDTESLHYVSPNFSKLVNDLYRTSDLGRIGAPVDYYFHNDMERDDMPDYKLYLMLNIYALTDSEREAIFRKARKNHASVVWLYAPGFINQSSGKVMTKENIEKTVCMKLSQDNATYFPHFRIDPSSLPALNNISPSKLYGIIDRNVHSSVWLSPTELQVQFVNPRFAVEDENAVALGYYCADNKVALAMRILDGFTSIYCAAPVLRSDLIAGLALNAGCHIYSGSEDVLYANENFVAIHASSDGLKTISLKRKCSPYEVYEKRCYGENVDRIEVQLKAGETKMWSLSGEC